MLRAAPLLRRSAALPALQRRTNFIKSFQETIKKEVDSNPELKKTLDELRNNKDLNEAAAAAREAASTVSEAAAEAAEKAAVGVGKAAGKAADTAAAAGDTFASKGEAAFTSASEAASKMRGAAAEAGPSASAAGEAGEGAKAASDAAGDAGAKADDAPPPLYARLLDDAAGIFGSFKEKVLGGGGGGGTPSPADAPIDAETTAVVIKEPTFWERTFNQESEFFSKFKGAFGAAADASGGVGDRVDGIFGETEQAEAMRELRLLMPDFRQDEFLKHVGEELGPVVIGAYLSGDAELLRANCREQAYATLHASIIDRTSRQLVMDARVLYISEPELEGIRIIGGMPTPIVSFETHQLNCIKDLAGKVVEGDEDDIRAVHYLWALQPWEEPMVDPAAEAKAAKAAPKEEKAKAAASEAPAGEAKEGAEGEAKEDSDGEAAEEEEEVPKPPWQVTELAVRGMQSIF